MSTESEPHRDESVDALRGLAIGAMVWGHLGVAIYHPDGTGEPSTTLEAIPPLWTEVLGGIAPPLFLFVCGMMIRLAVESGRGSLTRQLWRMAALFAAGAAIDVLFWRIRPFTTVDVLYCIGLILPLTHLVTGHLPRWSRWLAPVVVLALTPLLQTQLGYSDYPIEMGLGGKVFRDVANQTSIANHWIIDGWFPLFPWLGFALLGAAVEERRLSRRDADACPPAERVDAPLWGAGAAALAVSLVVGWPDASARVEERLRAGGAFMPPDVGYVLSSLGVVLLLLTLMDRVPSSAALRPLRVLGRHPLFIYVAHFPLVKVVARVLPERLSLLPTTAMTLLALASLAVGATIVTRLFNVARTRLQASSPRTSGIDGSRK